MSNLTIKNQVNFARQCVLQVIPSSPDVLRPNSRNRLTPQTVPGWDVFLRGFVMLTMPRKVSESVAPRLRDVAAESRLLFTRPLSTRLHLLKCFLDAQ